MVFSFMDEKKGRILQAYDNQGELVIRKSKFFDFWSWEQAEKNFDLFVQFMGSTPVGDTKRVWNKSINSLASLLQPSA